jgi:hypothetical protein
VENGFGRAGILVLVVGATLLTSGCSSGSNAQMRVLQTSPDEATTLNVLMDGNTAFANVTLDNPTNYLSESAGSRHLQVEPSNSATPSIDETVSLTASTNYTLITTNFAASLTPILLTDSQTAPASGNFQLRLVNAAPSAGAIDVYVVTPGTAAGSVAPTVSSLAFTAVTSYQSFTAGSYDMILTQAGFPGVPYVQLSSSAFSAGQNRTVVLAPNANGGYAAVMLNDLN